MPSGQARSDKNQLLGANVIDAYGFLNESYRSLASRRYGRVDRRPAHFEVSHRTLVARGTKRAQRQASRTSRVNPSSQIEDWLTADYVISICPPAAAESVAQSVIDWGYQGTLLRPTPSPHAPADIAKSLKRLASRCLTAASLGGLSGQVRTPSPPFSRVRGKAPTHSPRCLKKQGLKEGSSQLNLAMPLR